MRLIITPGSVETPSNLDKFLAFHSSQQIHTGTKDKISLWQGDLTFDSHQSFILSCSRVALLCTPKTCSKSFHTVWAATFDTNTWLHDSSWAGEQHPHFEANWNPILRRESSNGNLHFKALHTTKDHLRRINWLHTLLLSNRALLFCLTKFQEELTLNWPVGEGTQTQVSLASERAEAICRIWSTIAGDKQSPNWDEKSSKFKSTSLTNNFFKAVGGVHSSSNFSPQRQKLISSSNFDHFSRLQCRDQ